MTIYKSGSIQDNQYTLTTDVELEKTVIFALLDDMGAAGISAALKLYATTLPLCQEEVPAPNTFCCDSLPHEPHSFAQLPSFFNTKNKHGLVFLGNISLPKVSYSIVLLTGLPEASHIPECFDAIFTFFEAKDVKNLIIPGSSLLQNKNTSGISLISISPNNTDTQRSNSSGNISSDSIYSLVALQSYLSKITTKIILNFDKKCSQALSSPTSTTKTNKVQNNLSDPLFSNLLVELGINESHSKSYSPSHSFDTFVSVHTKSDPKITRPSFHNISYI